MATWTYVPEQVFVETVAVDVRRASVTPRTQVTGVTVPTAVRAFRLQYGTVTSADLSGMAAFYTARRGSWEAFSWVHPSDDRAYRVRFDGALSVSLFLPHLWRTGQDIVLEVVDE